MIVAINIWILLYRMEMEEINYFLFVFVFVIVDTVGAPWNENIFVNVGGKIRYGANGISSDMGEDLVWKNLK